MGPIAATRPGLPSLAASPMTWYGYSFRSMT